MGLFDTIAKHAMGGFLGGGQVEMLQELLTQGGGLPGVAQRFEAAGLQEVFASWVSTGPNQAVTASQVQAALGEENVQRLVGKLGFDSGTLLPLMAQFLPNIIDKLTPGGAIENPHPTPDDLRKALDSAMSGTISSFFSRR